MDTFDRNPSSGFLLTLHVIEWTVLTVGLVMVMVVFMMN